MIWRRPDVMRLLVTHLLLYTGMNLSKTAWPLYLDAEHALYLLAASYTAMAITGVAGAAVTGWLVDRIGIAAVISAGSIIYGAGLLLRLQYISLLLAVTNGVIMGIGASALISCLRPWMVQVTDNDTRPRVISYRTATLNIGMAVGAALLTPILLITGDRTFGYAVGLIVPALIIVFIALIRPRNVHKPELSAASEKVKQAAPVAMIAGVIVLGALGGLGLSMLLPYIPLILTGAHVSPVSVGLVVAALSIARVLAALIIGRLDRARLRLPALAGAQIVIAAATATAALMHASVITVALLAAVYVALGVSAFCEEIIQSEMLPARWRGRLFGLAQSGFLAGDAIGGTLGAILLSKSGTSCLLLVYAGTSLVTAVVYPAFILRMRATSGTAADSASPKTSA